jgi:hypothetical protein
MYLVLMLEHNRVMYAKVFHTFDDAAAHADELVMMLKGVDDEMPDWEGGAVYEHDGYGSETVIVTGCHAPPDDGEHNSKVIKQWINKDWYYKNNKNDY